MAKSSKSGASLLLWTLLEVSEKAARIARECRSENELFTLLVQEKSEKEKNTRFVQDFKTLADVLIQETVRHYLSEKFPALKTHIRGEETNEFTNVKGHQILVELKSTEAETASLLEKVLDGNTKAAALLAHAAHAEPKVEETIRKEFESIEAQLQEQDVPLDDVGIWIDPIDGTAEYVQGKWDEEAKEGLSKYGLNCCTILIGGYRRSTGVPCFGVVSQAFAKPDGGPTRSYFSFGKVTGLKPLPLVKDIVLSSSEAADTIQKLSKEFTTVHCAGAGFKVLAVALGLCSVYLCTKKSTYRWDTCAPHALIVAQGGGVREFAEDKPILYNVANSASAKNNGGVIAYRDEKVLKRVLAALEG